MCVCARVRVYGESSEKVAQVAQSLILTPKSARSQACRVRHFYFLKYLKYRAPTTCAPPQIPASSGLSWRLGAAPLFVRQKWRKWRRSGVSVSWVAGHRTEPPPFVFGHNCSPSIRRRAMQWTRFPLLVREHRRWTRFLPQRLSIRPPPAVRSSGGTQGYMAVFVPGTDLRDEIDAVVSGEREYLRPPGRPPRPAT